MTADSFRKMYPRADEFEQARAVLDPNRRFDSSLARRLEIGVLLGAYSKFRRRYQRAVAMRSSHERQLVSLGEGRCVVVEKVASGQKRPQP